MGLDLNRRTLTATAIAAVALAFALAASTAAARGLFGVIAQTPLGTADVAPLQSARPATVRFLLDWSTVQHTRGPCNAGSNFSPGTGPEANNCDWAAIDENISYAAQAGARGLPFLFGSPSWLRAASKASSAHPYVPPIYRAADRSAWQDFVSAAVDRYGPGGKFWETFSGTPHPVHSWQVWNEPTSPAYFAPRPNVARYVQLLKISHRAIKSADHGAEVVLAGVFGTPLPAGGGIDMPKYFKRLYAIAGVERYFDVAAVHPYSPGIGGVRLQIETARDLMRQNGDAHTKLWITEIGWASDGPKHHTLTSTRKGQARLLRKAFSMMRANRARWHLAGVNWFSWRDAPKDLSSCSACPYTGLLELDGAEKPAFGAFTGFTN